MKYRNFGPTGIVLSSLSFGTLRLPVIDGKDENINENATISMMRYAIDNGVNYIDTSYLYHGGSSEVVVGKALRDGCRRKVYLADKMPPVGVNTFKDMDKIFQEQLNRLQTDSN